jgi:TorA maturation chaperone TorD
VTSGTENRSELASGRARTYAVLSALYLAPPSQELVTEVLQAGLGGGRDNPLARALVESLRSGTEGRAGSDVVAEHTRLFVLPSGVVPNESNYLDDNRRVGGHVTVAVQQFYEAAAARFSGACLELPDHIGVELEFMKFLCDIESQLWQAADLPALDKCVEFQCRFLDEHLLRWHRSLCDRIAGESILELYRALARLTADFLEAERAYVPELAREVGTERRDLCALAS